MRALVLLEQESGSIRQASRSALAAAAELGAEAVDALLAGEAIPAELAAAAARLPGVARVLVAESPALAGQTAEPLAALLAHLAPGCSHVLAASTGLGRNTLPRLAGLLGVQPVIDVAAVLAPGRYLRPIYAGNALAEVESAAATQVLTVRAASFPPVPAEGGAAAVEALAVPDLPAPARLVSREVAAGTRPELEAARVVVAGGRGMASAEGFRELEILADLLGAAVGASRAAVDAGLVGNQLQVGQTGRVVAPELYVAFGISGAIQHLAGMKDSRIIVAVNKDAEAAIFQVADYGLVADVEQVLPELIAALRARPASA